MERGGDGLKRKIYVLHKDPSKTVKNEKYCVTTKKAPTVEGYVYMELKDRCGKTLAISELAIKAVYR